MIELVITIWFFLSPVIYPVSLVRDALSQKQFWLYSLNPMVGIIEAYRDILVRGVAPNFYFLAIVAVVSLGILVVSYRIFKHYEGKFAEAL